MELKRLMYIQFLPSPDMLLIVPYGIETYASSGTAFGIIVLLIVPYGIETRKGKHTRVRDYDLLIVPYGIETI